MYATVRSYPNNPGLAEALMPYQDEVRRLISEIGGFRAYYLIKTGDGTASVSVFDDQSGAEESTRVAADFIRTNLSDLNISPPQVSSGEVVIQA